MPELQICNFCELFGFNSRLNPVGRLQLKIGSNIYPPGFEFTAGTRHGTIEIARHLDDLALVYDEAGILVLHMFVPDGVAPRILVNCTSENNLYRYSSLKYLKDAQETGHFFIFPALEYIKKEYDAARKDNELVHEKSLAAGTVTIPSENNFPIIPTGDVSLSTISLPIDSYILCFSYDYDEGLYEEFKGSDACLVIHDVDQFADRVNVAFTEAMPSYLGHNGRVTYGNHRSSLGVLFSKPKSHIYQREYRFVWAPKEPTRMLDPVHWINKNLDEIRAIIPAPVEICAGPLDDITSLITRS
jgi:hypothetical protein